MNDYLVIILCILLVIGIYYLHQFIQVYNSQQNNINQNKSKNNRNLIREENRNINKNKNKKIRFVDPDLESLLNVDLEKYKHNKIKPNFVEKKDIQRENNSYKSFDEESNLSE